MTSRAEAVDVLLKGACTDAAVETLEELARGGGDAGVWNDLAAAYYVRAQRDDAPLDLLRADDAVEQHALVIAPAMPEARFNRALIEEALGLADALERWDELRRAEDSPWSREAADHWRRLDRDIVRSAARRWPLNRQNIPRAVERHDQEALVSLIATHTAAARRFVEEELLPAWARADSDEAARQQLRVARAVAREIARESGDRYLVDAVSAVEHALHTPLAASLRDAHVALAEGRAAEQDFDYAGAARSYDRAASAFAAAGSPMHLSAQAGLSIALAELNDISRASSTLDAVERAARERGYAYLVGRTCDDRAFVLFLESRYIDALRQYDSALVTFRRLDDGENAAHTHTREIGMYRLLGQKELAWREALQARRYAPYLIDSRSRHHLLGEMAAAALAAGYPRIAIRYQNEAIDLLQKTPVTDVRSVEGQRTGLAIAFRARAGIWLAFKPHEEIAAARGDLMEAIRLATRQAASDENTRRALMARVAELQGLAAACGDAQIQDFTRALSLASPSAFRTFRAAVFAERARAHRCAGHSDEAAGDLLAAINELHIEERGILENRRRGEGEPLWAGYFSRFTESYQRLIRLTIEENRSADAFAWTEEARAFEPLNLVLTTAVVPESFRKLTRNGETLRIADVQQHLPPGTFLVEFCVLDDRTFAWVVSRDRAELVMERVRRDDIERWTKHLRDAAQSRNAALFEAGLQAPFLALVADPLARIEAMPYGRSADRRIVFVPDGAMHGLPFAALRNPATQRNLIRDSIISIAPSATLYVFSRLRDAALNGDDTPSVLLVGDPAFRHEPSFPPTLRPLPIAAEEIRDIGRIYGVWAHSLPGRRATVPAFLEMAKESTIIHFAGHALVNDDAPFRSMLVLAPAEHRSGALDAEELLTKLDVQRTRLFVLGACRTARGGMGLAPLLRPIVTAGVPGIIGSLWDVESVPTETLLVQFHRYFHEGNDAESALRLAQLDLMNRSDTLYNSPLTWAPFEAIGHASSPFARTLEPERKQP